MKFEWDQEKSVANEKKHGLSFEDAVNLWQEPYIEVQNIAYAQNEHRSATLGRVNGKIFVAIWTFRGDKIRLISVRRARKHEEELYKEKI